MQTHESLNEPRESQDLEAMAERLDHSANFQVLRKVTPITAFNSGNPPGLHKVCIIDTETTGLDTAECEIIELGYQVVEFDSQGLFYKVLLAKNFLQEPKGIISEDVTRVTGITLEDVKGHQIPWAEVENDLADVQLCVAHNAGFDRPILERFNPLFIDKVWGCSVHQIDWASLANVSIKSQEYLAWKVGGFFYDAHRALDDVQALTLLLQQNISESQQTAFHFLLTTVRKQKVFIKATRAPFELKDELKKRQYRWNPSEKVWQKMLDADLQEAELAWLIENNTPNPTLIKLKATDTFSVRAE